MDEEPTQDEVDGTLYDRFALAIFTYICQHLSNRQDAEDLLVEVFLAAFKNDGLSSLPVARQLAWLLRVTRNKLVDRHRHHALLTLVPIELASEVEDGAPTPEQYAEQQENRFSESWYGCAIPRVSAFATLPVSSRNPRWPYGNCIRVRFNSYGGSTTRQREGGKQR